MTQEELDRLLPLASEVQKRILQAVYTEKGTSAAARALGVARGTVLKAIERLRIKAARKDPEMHSRAAPAGYHLKGVSTLGRDAAGRLQWTKTQVDRFNPDEWAQAFAAAVEACEIAPRMPDTEIPHCPDDLIERMQRINVLPIGDPHFGLLTWPKETGAAWDLKIAAEAHRRAVRRLLMKAPPASTCLVAWMGDNSHANDQSNATPRSKHPLDTDSRWERMLDVLFAAMINSIEIALAVGHGRVIVRIVKGNHDPEVSASLALALEAYYRNEPRVQIERQPTPLFVFVWGRVLLAFTHGHEPTPDRVPDILAADYRKEIGATEQGYLYTGHVHSKVLRERGGLRMESVQTLAARDSYATHAGFRSGRGLFVDTYDQRYLVATDRAAVAAQDLGDLEVTE